MRKRTALGNKCRSLILDACTNAFNTDPMHTRLRGNCRYSWCPSHEKELYFEKTIYSKDEFTLTDSKGVSMKRVVADKVDTRFFRDADKSKVYVTILDGREALLVTYDGCSGEYTSVTLRVHTTRKVQIDTDDLFVELTRLLDDYINTGYAVYEFDGIVEALKYITENI